MKAPLGGLDRILLFNKPHGVLTRFTDNAGRPTLAQFIDVPRVYPVGRLDADSEGLLLLTDRAGLVQPLLGPGSKEKRYLVCVEGVAQEAALLRLRQGVMLKDGPAMASLARTVEQPEWLWDREPSIRYRKSVPTSWLELAIDEGRNRQVRRMTAAVGLPTLRLIRVSFGPLTLGALPSGGWREATACERTALLQCESEFAGGRRGSASRGRSRRSGRRTGQGQRSGGGRGRGAQDA